MIVQEKETGNKVNSKVCLAPDEEHALDCFTNVLYSSATRLASTDTRPTHKVYKRRRYNYGMK